MMLAFQMDGVGMTAPTGGLPVGRMVLPNPVHLVPRYLITIIVLWVSFTVDRHPVHLTSMIIMVRFLHPGIGVIAHQTG